MKKVFITGSSGFVGNALAKELILRGHDVVGTDQALPLVGSNFRHIQGDLSTMDLNLILSAERPDWIIHCAGNANVGLSIVDPMMDLNSSLVLSHRLLYALKFAGLCPNVLFFSSAAVYGNPSDLPIKEASLRRPVSPYGLHKAGCEDLFTYFNRVEKIPCRSVRVFSAYGAGLRKQLLWDLYSKSIRPGKIPMFGTGAETRDFIHIHDVVRAALLVLEHGSEDVYNIANGEETRIDQVGSLLLSAMGESPSRLSFNGVNKEGDPLNWKADISKIKSLGYKPEVLLEMGISQYVSWVKSLA